MGTVLGFILEPLILGDSRIGLWVEVVQHVRASGRPEVLKFEHGGPEVKIRMPTVGAPTATRRMVSYP